jgi:Tfp pilus assembly protein PilZ
LFESEVDRREALLNSVTPKFPSANERREDRFDVSLTATYQTPHEFVVDKVLNISNGGVFIESNNTPEEGSDVEIRVYPSEVEDAIDLCGQVVWNKSGQGFGVRLTEPEPTERALLNRLIRRLAERTTPKK